MTAMDSFQTNTSAFDIGSTFMLILIFSRVILFLFNYLLYLHVIMNVSLILGVN